MEIIFQSSELVKIKVTCVFALKIVKMQKTVVNFTKSNLIPNFILHITEKIRQFIDKIDISKN